MGTMHNTRLLRFLIALTVVVLTIFIYTSYSSTQSFTPPHMRSAITASLINGFSSSSSSSNSTNTSKSNEQDLNGGHNILMHYSAHHPLKDAKAYHRNVAGNEMIFYKKLIHHREPTIDENALDGGGGSDNVEGETIFEGKALEPGTGESGGGGGNVDITDDAAALALENNNNDLQQDELYVQSADNTMGNNNNSMMSGASGAGAGNSLTASGSLGVDANRLTDQQQLAAAMQQNQQAESIGAIINENSNSNNLNKIPESDVLIPTSNLQKFIENADKILKNITIPQQPKPQEPHPQSPSAVAPSGGNGGGGSADDHVAVGSHVNFASVVDQRQAISNKLPDNNNVIVPQQHQLLETVNGGGGVAADADEADEDEDIEANEVLPPSVIMTIKGAGSNNQNNNNEDDGMLDDSIKPQNKNKEALAQPAAPPQAPIVKSTSKFVPKPKLIAKVQIDPTQGIPTKDIYEPGHMMEELDTERICPKKGSDLKLLILITSAQTHSDARLSIRQTWGHYGTRRDVSAAFILGRTTNETINQELSKENYMYGDLIRGHFMDSYNNLTLKTLSSLEWIDQYCPKVKYILKTDDDMFINVPKLLQFLDSHSKEKRVIYGRLAKKWKPIRNKKSKYYISPDQYGAAIFPPFTTGPAYVLTSDIVHELYTKSLQQVYLKLEDVFTTGIVAQQLNIKRVHVNEFLNRRIAFNPCNIRKAISVHMIKSNEQFDLWKKLLDQTTKCK